MKTTNGINAHTINTHVINATSSIPTSSINLCILMHILQLKDIGRRQKTAESSTTPLHCKMSLIRSSLTTGIPSLAAKLFAQGYFSSLPHSAPSSPSLPPILLLYSFKLQGRQTMYSNGESHRRAILASYPDIGLSLDKWHHLPSAYSKSRKTLNLDPNFVN